MLDYLVVAAAFSVGCLLLNAWSCQPTRDRSSSISHFFYNALDGALPGTAAVTVIQKVGGEKGSVPTEDAFCRGQLKRWSLDAVSGKS